MTSPDQTDPDSKDHISFSHDTRGEPNGIGRMIERLGANMPSVDLRPADADDSAGASPLGGKNHLRVVAEIARGGMGVVLRGHEQELRRDVAIKVLQQRYADKPEVLARFVEEAQIGGQLQHPGVVPVYELGVLADQRPYFTMKLVKGETLSDHLKSLGQTARGAAEQRQLLDIFLSICMTMAYAHSRRVIHRDLKPANVMVGAFGEVQVVDWGLAKVLPREGEPTSPREQQSTGSQASFIETLRSEPGSTGASVAGSVFGTPGYMPPEQARGETELLDQRSDVFSLGAILCELLTGEPPYGHDFRAAIMMAVKADLGAANARLDACGADPALIEICRQCLAPAMQARPADAGVLAKALQQYLAAIEQRVRDAQLAAVAATTRAEAARRTRNLTVALAATVLLAIGLGGGGVLWVRAEAQQRLEAGLEKVREITSEVSRLQGEQRWVEAAASARRAFDLMPQDAPPAFTETVRNQLTSSQERARVEQQAAEVAADNVRLLAELRNITEPSGGRYMPTDWTRVEANYSRVFAAHGLPIDSPSLVEDVRGREVGVPVAQALVEWATVRRARGDQAGSGALLRLAIQVDPEPQRVALRTAVLAGNAAAVEAFASAATEPGGDPATMVELVRSLAAVGRAGVALDAQLTACLRHPDDSLLAYEVATALGGASRNQEAVRLLHGALAARPDSRPVRRALASLYELGLHDIDSAERLVRESLQSFPEDAYLHLRLASCLLARERIDPQGVPRFRQPATSNQELALGELHRAIELGGHPDYFQVLAYTLNGLGRFEDAIAAAQQGLGLAQRTACDDLTQARLKHSGCTALSRLGRHEEALTMARSAVKLAPELPQTTQALVSCLQFTDPAESIAVARAYLDEHPDCAPVMAVLASSLSMVHDRSGSVALFRRVVELDPGDAFNWLNLASAVLQTGDLPEVLRVCEAALVHHPEVWELIDLQSTMLVRAGRSDEARKLLEERQKRDPRNPVVCAGFGRLESVAGNRKEAARWYREAIDLGMRTPTVYVDLASMLTAIGDLSGALSVHDQAIAIWPNLGVLRHGRAQCYSAMGRTDEALAEAELAVKVEPGRAYALETLAIMQATAGRYREAAKNGMAALRPSTGEQMEFEPPPRKHFAMELGTRFLRTAPAAAVEFLKVATQTDPSGEAWCNLGHALNQVGRFEESLQAMRTGDELGRKRSDWRYPSQQWVQRGELMVEAEKQWLACLETGELPTSFDQQFGMGSWALSRGRPDVAMKLLELVVAGVQTGAEHEKLQDMVAEAGLYRNLATSAVLVAAGDVGVEVRGRLWQIAQTQLIEHGRKMRRFADANAANRGPITEHFRSMLQDERLDSVRSDAALATMSEADATQWRDTWRKLHEDLAALEGR